MRMRILQTVTGAVRPVLAQQCPATTAPQLLYTLTPLHQRRFQSSNSPSSPGSSDKPFTFDLGSLLSASPSSSSSLNNNNTFSPSGSQASRTRHSSDPSGASSDILTALGLISDPNSFDKALAPNIQEDNRVPRMGPTAGRSVLVQGDVTVAFTRLRNVVQANRVRADLNKQRFHERPGLKRKRLQRERHKRRFKDGFKRMVGIVLDMKNRGM